VIAHRYLPAAREELIEAAAFYERAAVGLGDDFLDDVERAIETLQEHPRIGSPAGRRFRKLHIAAWMKQVAAVPGVGRKKR
jgi:plasmid stabilization system protein ParE